jgi:hypothetical protein
MSSKQFWLTVLAVLVANIGAGLVASIAIQKIKGGGGVGQVHA